jgi:hypothetical protein
LMVGFLIAEGSGEDLPLIETLFPLVDEPTRLDLMLMLSYKSYVDGSYQKSEAMAQRTRELTTRLHQPRKELIALCTICFDHVKEQYFRVLVQLLSRDTI